LAVRAIRTVGVVLPIRPGRVLGDRALLARAARRGTCRRGRCASGSDSVGVAARAPQGPGCRPARGGVGAAPPPDAARDAAVSSPAPARPVEVAAGVILTGAREFLLTQRPVGKPYAGYWEFPGGKVETGEPAAAALARELREELGIEVTRACPWIVREHIYA